MSKRKDYGDDALAQAIARGRETYAQIAERFGLCESYVCAIAVGRSRRDLFYRIQMLRRSMRREARQHRERWLGPLLDTHVREGLQRHDETARKCREFAIGYLSAQDEGDDPPEGTFLAAPGLTDEDMEYLAQRHGAPSDQPRPFPLEPLDPTPSGNNGPGEDNTRFKDDRPDGDNGQVEDNPRNEGNDPD